LHWNQCNADAITNTRELHR
jgi:ligand-binding sensor domain-containing protein